MTTLLRIALALFLTLLVVRVGRVFVEAIAGTPGLSDLTGTAMLAVYILGATVGIVGVVAGMLDE